MALRVGGALLPQEEAISEPAVMPETEMPVEMPMDMPMSGQVSPESARYLGPEARCTNCIHFTEGGEGGGTCEIVSGPIDPQGVCMLFMQDAEEDIPDNPELAEAPIEEEV